MRIVLTPNDPESHNPESEPDVYRFAFDYIQASGNIHIINTDIIEQVYDTIGGDVMVAYNDGDTELVEDYTLSSIEGL